MSRDSTQPVEHQSESRKRLSRNALPMTLTEDSAMAAAAMTGDSVMPSTG